MATKKQTENQVLATRGASAGITDDVPVKKMSRGEMDAELAALKSSSSTPAIPDPEEGDLVRITSLRNGPRIVAEPARVLAVHDGLILDVAVLDAHGKQLRIVNGLRKGTLREKKAGVWIHAPTASLPG